MKVPICDGGWLPAVTGSLHDPAGQVKYETILFSYLHIFFLQEIIKSV